LTCEVRQQNYGELTFSHSRVMITQGIRGLPAVLHLTLTAVAFGYGALPVVAQTGIPVGASIYGTYAFNVHGQLWSLDVRQVPGQPGALTGVLSAGFDRNGNPVQDPITGYFSRTSSEVVILRGSGALPGTMTEVYIGRFGQASIYGTAHRLLAQSAQSDFTPGKSDVGFSASRQPRQPLAPRDPRLPPAPMPAVAGIRGPWSLNANGSELILAFDTPGTGNVRGLLTSPPGASVETVGGHYTAANGRLAFVRLSGGLPIQVFVGSLQARSSTDHRLNGSFYPLTASAGANAALGAFPFRALRLPVYKLTYDGIPDNCLSDVGGLTLRDCRDSPRQLFAILERPPLPGQENPRLAILKHESGTCLGTDQPALGQLIDHKPCQFSEFWTFEKGQSAMAMPNLTSLINTGTLCLGINESVSPMLPWLQTCRALVPLYRNPLWDLKQQPF
jgi:hypothetical protein